MLNSRPGQGFKPRTSLVGEPLRAVKDLDVVGLAAGVDGRQAALQTVGTLGHAIPALLCVAGDIGLRRQSRGQRRCIVHAVVVGHQKDRLAGRCIVDLRQRRALEPLIQPGAGDLRLDQIAPVVIVKLQLGGAGQHLADPRQCRRLTQF